MNDDKINPVPNSVPVLVHPRNDRLVGEIHRAYGLCILGGGHARTLPGSFEDCPVRRFEFFSISHMYDGGGRLWLAPDSFYEVLPGDAIVICPGTVNRYGGSPGKPYCEDTLHFYGPLANMLIRSGVLRSGILRLGLVRRLPPIAELARDPSADAQIAANIALQNLLIEAYLENRARTPEYSLIDKLLEELRKQPGRWWTVQEMAELCNISTSQLRRIFLSHTGTSPKQYVDTLKLRSSAERLLSSGKRIAEIAEEFGYRDPYHFSRRFKAMMGVSPEQYRRNAPH